MTAEALASGGVEAAFARAIDPDHVGRLRAAIGAGAQGAPLEIQVQLAVPGRPWVRALGGLQRDGDGQPVRLRGSVQDITAQREAEQALASAAAEREASARERQIADDLQHSLLPAVTFDPDQLEVATFYQPGVAGTQVGGDWYDVIDLGAGRTALVIGAVWGAASTRRR